MVVFRPASREEVAEIERTRARSDRWLLTVVVLSSIVRKCSAR